MQTICKAAVLGILVVMSGADSMDLKTLFGCLGTLLGIACWTALWDLTERTEEDEEGGKNL